MPRYEIVFCFDADTREEAFSVFHAAKAAARLQAAPDGVPRRGVYGRMTNDATPSRMPLAESIDPVGGIEW